MQTIDGTVLPVAPRLSVRFGGTVGAVVTEGDENAVATSAELVVAERTGAQYGDVKGFPKWP